jgi:CMP-N-acetylneuraminic acid synthetase
VPRQALLPSYRHDGGHAIVRLSLFLERPALLGPKTLGFLVPTEESVDIDEPIDMAWAEFLLERRFSGCDRCLLPDR